MEPASANLHPEFRTQQSGGFMHVQLMVVQVFFVSIYIVLILGSTEIGSVFEISGLLVSQTTVLLILLGLALQAIFSAILFMRWKKTVYIITDKHLEVRRGIIVSDTRSIELVNFVSAGVHRTILGKFYGYGTVSLKIRFENNPVLLEGVPFPEQFVERIQAGISPE